MNKCIGYCRQRRCKPDDGLYDTQTGILSGIPNSAMCVQRFDDSRNSAIHITFRNSLRSSSLQEPRDPLLKVVFSFRNHMNALVNRHGWKTSTLR